MLDQIDSPDNNRLQLYKLIKLHFSHPYLLSRKLNVTLDPLLTLSSKENNINQV